MTVRMKGSWSTQTVLLCAFATLLTVAGCTEHRDRSGLLKNIATQEMTFAGRKTGMGELAITVPKAYIYDYEGSDLRDNYFFTDPGDTSEIQKGMIYISIGTTPLPFIPDTAEVTKTGGTIVGEDLEWREAIATTAGSARLYQREAIAKELMKLYPSPGTKGTYLLQAFVVGTDQVLVERLMAAVESLRVVKKGNV